MSPQIVPAQFRIIAHRGASGYAPENTLAAFRQAEAMGASEIEFDIQLSKDGKLVVVHDDTLDRFGFPNRAVVEMTLAELKSLDMGGWFEGGEFAGERIATVSEIFDAFGELFIYHAEIKAPSHALADDLIALIDDRGYRDRVIVTSFDYDILLYVREQFPEQRVGWLVRHDGFSAANVEKADAAGFFQFCPRADEMTAERVIDAKKRIPEIRAHGIKTKANLAQAVAAGCDGTTVNWPDWLTKG